MLVGVCEEGELWMEKEEESIQEQAGQLYSISRQLRDCASTSYTQPGCAASPGPPRSFSIWKQTRYNHASAQWTRSFSYALIRLLPSVSIFAVVQA